MPRTPASKTPKPPVEKHDAADPHNHSHSHSLRDRKGLINRVHRLRGQVDAIERGLSADAGCSDIIQRVTAARGAIDALMAELLEEHVREYLLADAPLAADARQRAAEELIGIIHTYLT